jgi:hypothetical protein
MGYAQFARKASEFGSRVFLGPNISNSAVNTVGNTPYTPGQGKTSEGNNSTDTAPINGEAASPVGDSSTDASKPSATGAAIQGGALSKVFRNLVSGLCGVAFILLIIAIIINIVAQVTYYSKEISQSYQLNVTPILITDTTDFQAMEYAFSDTSRDPYMIYAQQSILSKAFFVIGLILFILALQVAIIVGMTIWAKYKGVTIENETISHSPIFIGLAIGTFVIGLILQNVFSSKFVKKTQPSIRTVVDRMNALKRYMYSYMTTNAPFLKALREESSVELQRLVQTSAENASALSTLTRMAVTYNIYRFFASTIPDHNRSNVTLGKIFTPEGIKTQQYNLLIYTVYKSLANIENYFINDYGKMLVKSLGDNYSTFVDDLNSRMEYIGNNIEVANEVERAKILVKEYMNSSFITILMIILLILIAFALIMYVYRKMAQAGIKLGK